MLTNVEKMLKADSGSKTVIIPDIVMINDGPGNDAVNDFICNKTVKQEIKDKVTVVLDHDIPAGSFDTAFIQKKLIDFSKKENIDFIQAEGTGYQVLFDRKVREGDIFVSCGEHNAYVGAKGALGLNISIEEMEKLLEKGEIEITVPSTIEIILQGQLEEGVSPWDVALTYMNFEHTDELRNKIIVFIDETKNGLTENQKKAICIGARGAGAASAIFEKMKKTEGITVELGRIKRMAALPGKINDTVPTEEIGRTKVNACFIGGCACGHIEDIRKAAEMLSGKRIKRELRLLIGFSDNKTYLQAVHEGLIDIFFDAGAQVTNPGCGSCKTTSIGVVGDGEVLVSTGCYNYAGCAGTKASKVYLASTETVIKAAIDGYIGV